MHRSNQNYRVENIDQITPAKNKAGMISSNSKCGWIKIKEVKKWSRHNLHKCKIKSNENYTGEKNEISETYIYAKYDS